MALIRCEVGWPSSRWAAEFRERTGRDSREAVEPEVDFTAHLLRAAHGGGVAHAEERR